VSSDRPNAIFHFDEKWSSYRDVQIEVRLKEKK